MRGLLLDGAVAVEVDIMMSLTSVEAPRSLAVSVRGEVVSCGVAIRTRS